MNEIKILAIGDFHGKLPRNIKQIIKKEKIVFIISQGDFPPYDRIRKIHFELIRKGSKKKLYKWYEVIGKKKARKWISWELKKVKEVVKKLNSFDLPIYLVPGNLDFYGIKWSKWKYEAENHFSKILKNYKKIKNCHHKLVDCGGFQIIGYGKSSSPEIIKGNRKEKKEYNRNYSKIDKLFKKAKKPVIFLSHNVPHKTKLDKITNKISPRYGKHWGSIVIKEIIKKYQPLLCMGGHLHENQGLDKIGKTLIINPGAAKDGKYAIITIKDNKVKVKFKK